MEKIKVLFAKTEAGMGHIVPLTSIKEKFEEKYGDQFDIEFVNFFVDPNTKAMSKYNKLLINTVKSQNKCHLYGHATTKAMSFFGTRLSSYFTMRMTVRHVYRDSLRYLEQLKPDVVVSSHFATNYYAEHMKNKPLTIMYSPDVIVMKLFAYRADMVLTPMDFGYNKALESKRFTCDNLKLVDLCLRNQLLTNTLTKEEAAKGLGIDSSKFTICIADGGYGIGKTLKLLKICISKNMNINFVAICGKNEKLYKEIKQIKENNKSSVSIYPVSFNEYSINYLIASDIFCGKSGANAIAEAVYLCKPVIITGCATDIEDDNARYYVKEVGCAKRISSYKKIIREIFKLMNNKDEYNLLSNNAKKIHKNFGADKAADEIYKLIKAKIIK